MKKELSRFVYYHDMEKDPVLRTLAETELGVKMMKRTPGSGVEGDWPGQREMEELAHFGHAHPITTEILVDHVYDSVHRLLDTATAYGFDKNLWRDYLAFLLITNENPFSLTAEKKGLEQGSVQIFALQDMENFCRLFIHDFSELEQTLGIDCFSVISEYKAVPKRAQNYNRYVSGFVREVSDSISSVLTKYGFPEKNVRTGSDIVPPQNADDIQDESARIRSAAEEVLGIISGFYKKYGVGMFGLNRAFRLKEAEGGKQEKQLPGTASGILFEPINNIQDVRLSDLVGYEIQKQKLRENTEAFLRGHRANNCLLFGDAGTGKSTSIKALIAEYYEQGLRMIELYKHQMQSLSEVISTVKHRNYKFIIYMDDLSFEDHETEYKYLKAVIEGGLENRPDNVLIYATSNRRNLIKETWNDTADVDLEKHRGDTLQEKLSLVDRFGIKIPYMKPNKKEYSAIVEELAKRVPGLDIDPEELQREAAKWEVAHGGMSGRTAQQLIDYLAAKYTDHAE